MSILNKVSQLSQAILDRMTGAEEPKLYFNPKGNMINVLENIPLLQQKYRPTPWLSNPHLHLAYFDIIQKKRVHLEYDRIEILTMQDGGVTAIAWYGNNLSKDTPTIVVMHTITGSPESMRELVKDLHEYTGWRIALCLRRGHAGLPMPVPQMSLFGSTADLKEQIDYIQKHFPLSDLYAVGSSAGTGLLVRYLGDQGLDTPFKAAFALCPGYNTKDGFENVHPFYSKLMTKKLFKAFIQPYQQTWRQTQSIHLVLKTKTLQEFQLQYFEMAGFSDYESYDRAINPIYVFENVKIPLMVLNAEDDPVCAIQNLEPHKNKIENMPNVVVVTTKKGSHCGFYEGLNTKSWASRLIADFLKYYH